MRRRKGPTSLILALLSALSGAAACALSGCTANQTNEDAIAGAAIPSEALFAINDGDEGNGTGGGPARELPPPLTAVQLHRLIAEQNAVLACATKAADSMRNQTPQTDKDGASVFSNSTTLGKVSADVQAVVKRDPTNKDNFGSSMLVAPKGGTPAKVGQGFYTVVRSEADAGKPLTEDEAVGKGKVGIKSGWRADLDALAGAVKGNTSAAPIEGVAAFSAEHSEAGSIWQVQLDKYRNGMCVTGVDNSDVQEPVVCPAAGSKHQVHLIKSSKKFPGKTITLARALGDRNVFPKSDACEREIVSVRRVVGVGGWGRATIYGGDLPLGRALLFREVWTAAGGVTYRRSWDCPYARETDAEFSRNSGFSYAGCKFMVLGILPPVGGTAPEAVQSNTDDNPWDPANVSDFKAAVIAAVGANQATAEEISNEADPTSDVASVLTDETTSGIVDPSEAAGVDSTEVNDATLTADGSPVEQAPATTTYGPGTHVTESMVIGDDPRTYILYVPTIYDPSSAVPLVIALHGAGNTSTMMEEMTGFNDIAEKENFVVVYPEGLGQPLAWNNGINPDDEGITDADDITFIQDLIARISSQLAIDPDRIYVAGYSNGGFMAHRIGAMMPDKIAAIAAVEGSVGLSYDFGVTYKDQVTPIAPMSVLTIHGRKDTTVPYDGGYPGGACTPALWYTRTAQDALNFWTKSTVDDCRDPVTSHSGLLKTETFTDPCQGQNFVLDTYYPVEVTDYQVCKSGTQVIHYALRDGSHSYPKALPIDGQNKFHASEVIWAFFKKHTRVTQ